MKEDLSPKREKIRTVPDFLELVDMELLIDMMQRIAKATGMGIAAVDYAGAPVAGSIGYCDFCKRVQKSKEGKRACEASTAIGQIQSATKHEPYIYVCPHGLLEVSIPIVVDNEFLAGIVAGQIYCTAIPEEVPKLATLFPEEIICTEKYSEELTRSKAMTYEEFEAIAQMVYVFLTEVFKGKAEVSYLSSSEGTLSKASELKQKLELLEEGQLRSTLSDNFIANILFTIANQAAVEGAFKTNEMIGALSEFVQGMSIRRGKNRFLCDEIRNIEYYLELQKQRFEELEYEITLPAEMNLYMIPSTLLYPIVEHSICYGLRYKQGKKNLKIMIDCDGNYVDILVEDNGLGVTYNELKALHPQIAGESRTGNEPDSCINIIKKRLDLLFSKNYHLSIELKKDEGGKIHLKYPKTFARRDD